jgi:hypothetical protein
VRPPDENQPGSRRPNLMSTSRRAAATDDSILARIERDASRKRGGGARRALWIAAGATVLLLIGALAWLTRENARVHKTVLQPGAALTAADAITRVADAALPPPAPPTLAAPIIDEPPDTVRVPVDPHAVLPPLVKLAPTRSVHASDKAAKAPAKSASARIAAPPAHATESPTAATSRAPARPAPPRLKKSPSPPEPEASPVDSDVALISAIIMHSSTHSAERAEVDAEGESASPPVKKPGRRSAPAAPKTTD